MAKPIITNANINTILEAIIIEASTPYRFWIAYGAAFGALLIGLSEHFSMMATSSNFALLIVLAMAHWRSRDKFGQGPALLQLDAYDLTPSAEIRRIENDPGCKAWGIDITKEDWPEIFKTGMRGVALGRLETFESKALSITGYGFAILMILFH